MQEYTFNEKKMPNEKKNRRRGNFALFGAISCEIHVERKT